MADKKRIRIARGTHNQRIAIEETSVAGHPIYETDKNKLFIGDGKTPVKNLKDITVSEAEQAKYALNDKQPLSSRLHRIQIFDPNASFSLSTTSITGTFAPTEIFETMYNLEHPQSVVMRRGVVEGIAFDVASAQGADGLLRSRRTISIYPDSSKMDTSRLPTSGYSSTYTLKTDYMPIKSSSSTSYTFETDCWYAEINKSTTNTSSGTPYVIKAQKTFRPEILDSLESGLIDPNGSVRLTITKDFYWIPPVTPTVSQKPLTGTVTIYFHYVN